MTPEQTPPKCQIKNCWRAGEYDLPFKGKKIRVCGLCKEIIMHKISGKLKGTKHT